MGKVGELSAEMVLDDKSFSATAQKMEGVIGLLRTELKDLGDSVRQVSDALAQNSKRGSKNNETMSEGEKALRGFYKEQKLGDRTLKEGQNALLGFTVGLSALITGTEGGSDGVKKFSRGILTTISAMQGAEFAAFGMGLAGKNLGGSLGKVAGFMERNAGMIGLVVGVGAGLISFFQDANKESSKAADEGLKKFAEGLKNLSPTDQIKTAENIDAKIKELRQQADALGTMRTKMKGDLEFEERVLSKDDEAKKSALMTRIGILMKLREKYNEQLDMARELKAIEDEQNGVTATHKSRLEEIAAELEKLNKQKTTGKALDGEAVLSAAQLRDIADRILTLEDERKSITMSTKDALDKEVKIHDANLKLGKISTDEYVKRLRLIENQYKAEEDRLAIEQKIKEALESQNKSSSVVSLDEYVKESVEWEEKRYKAALSTKEEYIEQLQKLQAQIGPGERWMEIQAKIVDLNKEDEDSSDKLVQKYMARYKLGELSAEQTRELLSDMLAATTIESDRIKIKQALVALEDDQTRKMNEQLDQAARISAILAQALSKNGDDFISKLNQALQIAIQIAKIISNANKPGGEGMGIMSWIETIATGLGVLALSKGDAGSSTAPTQSAQTSTAISILKQTVAQDVQSTISAMHIPASAMISKSNSNSTSGIIDEIQSMRAQLEVIRNTPPTIILRDVVTLGKGLEVEMPGYEKHRKSKQE